ncbi:MAG TPA: OsmC family peroxiredoxin [Euryarchaeota archaeon]|nr:OsmC family protein [Euryarchaeota archaeon]HHC19530.1 OsmC family peroxiredoxin [Euryarchaeota archaeon]
MKVEVSVRGRLIGKYTVEVEAAGHRIFYDIPKEKGGDGKGPTPVHGLLSSIIGCIGIIGRTLAEAMGFPIEELNVEVRGWYNPAAVRDRSLEATVNDIEVIVRIKSPKSKEEIEKFVEEIRRACFIEQTIEKPRDVRFIVEKIE